MSARRQTALTGWQFTGLTVGVIGVAAAMGIGFFDSFNNLRDAAAAHGWQHPYLLPLGVDAPIMAFVVLDLVAITLHREPGTRSPRSSWLHWAAWGLAAFTVWANGAVGVTTSTTWRIIYMAQPALWVLGVEALRWFCRRWLAPAAAEVPDHVPAGRWIANPFTAFGIQRRMWMLGERSWLRMAQIEDARQYARDIIRAARAQGRDVPDLLRGRAKSGRLSESVLSRVDAALAYPGSGNVEQAVRDWCASLMVLPELVSSDLRKAVGTTTGDRGETGHETPAKPEAEASEPASQRTTTRPARQRTPSYDRKPTPAAVRKMTPAELAPFVKAWVEQGNNPSIKAVVGHFRVGEAKARGALTEAGLWGADAAVIPLQNSVGSR